MCSAAPRPLPSRTHPSTPLGRELSSLQGGGGPVDDLGLVEIERGLSCRARRRVGRDGDVGVRVLPQEELVYERVGRVDLALSRRAVRVARGEVVAELV